MKIEIDTFEYHGYNNYIMALRCLVWKSLLTVININGNSAPLSFAAKPFADQLLYKKALGRLNSSLPQVR